MDQGRLDDALLARHAKLITDTRHICARFGLGGAHIVKA
jgi:hypothetical protein